MTDRLPVGTYDGRVLGPVSTWPFWRGKVFTQTPYESLTLHRVRNRIGPWLLVDGKVYWWPVNAEVEIRYPLGLRDYLKPVSDTLWLGYLRLGPLGKIWFTLEEIK